MIYRNGLKEYLTMGIAFGVPFGIIYGLMYLDVVLGIIVCVVGGGLFSLLMFLFVKAIEKKFDKKRVEIAGQRRIICDGGATIKGNGGWMFLTETGLEFYPHKINLSTENLFVPLSTIASVETVGNRLIVGVFEGYVFDIVVSKNGEWKKQIEGVLRDKSEVCPENTLDR